MKLFLCNIAVIYITQHCAFLNVDLVTNMLGIFVLIKEI